MIKNIRHSGIVVRNIDESYKFYQNLGFNLVSDEIEKGKLLFLWSNNLVGEPLLKEL